MCKSSGPHRLIGAAVLVCASMLGPGASARAQQGTAEESAFEAARAQTDPEARVQALQRFLANFPSGSRQTAAKQSLLDTYLADFPEQTDKIHAIASSQVLAAPPGFDRWTEEARLARLLADAGEKGVDLQDARVWAQDAVTSLSEESYRREMASAQLRYKLPRLPAKQMHTEFLAYRASFLATLASFDIRQNNLGAAAPLLGEAYRLQPLSGEVNALNGELALAQGNRAAALLSFERADAMGHLAPFLRKREVELYAELEHGDEDALETRVDTVYRTLYPPLFSLPKRVVAPGGHTALLELFTGSGCLPCAGPDLALDSLLGSYTRQDLVVLAFDEHIPRPDPLTAIASVTRAAMYDVASTPEAFLDGQPVDVLGASRTDVENIVIGFAEAIEDWAAVPSGLKLGLSVSTDGRRAIEAHPLLTPVAVSPSAPVTTGDVSLRRLAQAVLYVALVQDNIRYSGENGVRFHRMVVRAVQQFRAAAYLSTSRSSAGVTFDPVARDQEQVTYLTAYETTNDRFGAFHFATTHLPMQGGELAVVAWVQDPVSKRVLQTTYTAVPSR